MLWARRHRTSLGIKYLLYNDGYTIRGVQKVIKKMGQKNNF